MTPPADPFVLFVYGTLMHDGRNHALLAGQRFLGPARTLPLYTLFDLGVYPGLVHDGAQSVEGELYEVSASRFPVLEALEEAPGLFRLEPIEVEGRAAPVYAYFYRRTTEGVRRCAERWRQQR
jgi:gamma-glutamylcyclotransferase (GGCT)/AIG2-like uncharacterized protein YtfP